MALLSLGAAVENLMVAAADAGLASCWVAAPIFCPEAARDALALPDEWLPHALVLVGHPDPGYVGRPRPADPARRAPQVSLDRELRQARAGPGTTRGCGSTPVSRSVHGFHPRWISARPGSSEERSSSPGRAGAWFAASLNPVARAIES